MKINFGKRITTTTVIGSLAVLCMGAAASTRAFIEIGPIATVTSDFQPEIRLIDNGDGGNDSDWEIEARADAVAGDVFQIGLNNGLDEPFKIFAGANKDNLVLGDNGNIAINGSAATSSSEVEIFGKAGIADTSVGLGLTPKGLNADHSARTFVSSSSNIYGVGVREVANVYNLAFKVDLGAEHNSLVVDGDGDVGVGGIAIDSMDSNADLHVRGGKVFLDGAGTNTDWLTSVGTSGFALTNESTGAAPLIIANEAPKNTFRVAPNGDISMGTDMPDTALHIFRDDDTAGFKGGVRFALENLDVGERWDFTNNSIGDFLVNRIGTGGPELTVTRAGRLVSGPGGFAALDSRPNGNLFIKGSLFELSDRASKENFKEVDCEDVLEKISELPITTWNYKTDEDAVRHMGPVAQDFHAAFELGDSEKTIATSDKVGITLAAVKAINKKLDASQKEVRQKNDQLRELGERVEFLEDALELLIN